MKNSPTKILIIEDDPFLGQSLMAILQYEGYDLSLATNGSHGIAIAAQEKPHLIFCDILMPEMDGFEVLQQLQTQQIVPRIPFVFLTARVEKSDMQKGLHMGACAYLTKPVSRNTLLAAIQKHARKSSSATPPSPHAQTAE